MFESPGACTVELKMAQATSSHRYLPQQLTVREGERAENEGREQCKLLPKGASGQHQQPTPVGRHRKRERKQEGERENECGPRA
ncbi:uncharacterized [Tachysurus ichikawai]